MLKSLTDKGAPELPAEIAAKVSQSLVVENNDHSICIFALEDADGNTIGTHQFPCEILLGTGV